MSILEKWSKAIDDRDLEAMDELLHDDYEFMLHSAGKVLSKQDVIDWVASDDIVTSNNRISVSYTHLTLPTSDLV